VTMLESREGTPPVAQLLICPAVDDTRRPPSFALFGEGFFLDRRDRDDFSLSYGAPDPTDPCVSPLLAPSLDGMPPTMVVTAGFDILRDEGRAFATRLLDAGTRVMTLHYPSLCHGFVNLTTLVPATHSATVHVAAGFRMLIEGARSSGPRPENL
jgi:acetyl esterase